MEVVLIRWPAIMTQQRTFLMALATMRIQVITATATAWLIQMATVFVSKTRLAVARRWQLATTMLTQRMLVIATMLTPVTTALATA